MSSALRDSAFGIDQAYFGDAVAASSLCASAPGAAPGDPR